MDFWSWEFFSNEMKSGYSVQDFGPLHGAVKRFEIYRDDSLQLLLKTTSNFDQGKSRQPLRDGVVFTPTAEVKFQGLAGSSAVASGVVPVKNTVQYSVDLGVSQIEEISLIHELVWVSPASIAPHYILEWVGNLSGPFVWPHSEDFSEEGVLRKKMRSEFGEVEFSAPMSSSKYRRTCVHLRFAGFDLFVGEADASPQYVNKPGYILYRGAPSEAVRSKIRDCLSFCFGNYLIYLGNTVFDDSSMPISFSAKSGHALINEASNLSGARPAPLGSKYKFEIDAAVLSRMMGCLLEVYDVFELQRAFWGYWHALAAPVHMTAAHFGGVIELIQRAYVKNSTSSMAKGVVTDKSEWKVLLKKIQGSISEANINDEQKRILGNKVLNLNSLPQGIAMERFFSELGLGMGSLEKEAWVNRNRAAHGSGNSDDGIRLIRENKVLHVMVNRILLAIANMGGVYIDYYTLGHPNRPLAEPVIDDRDCLDVSGH